MNDSNPKSSSGLSSPTGGQEAGARENILKAVKAAQPERVPLPEKQPVPVKKGDVQKFQTVLESIGGKVYFVSSFDDVMAQIKNLFPDVKRVVSSIPIIEQYLLQENEKEYHRSLHDVAVAIIQAPLAVAENGAVWITEEDVKIRVLPFICEHLVAVVKVSTIVADLHDAYQIIADKEYGFGAFIAGPSKTADIEQSLVLGAHGPKSMTVLLLEE